MADRYPDTTALEDHPTASLTGVNLKDDEDVTIKWGFRENGAVVRGHSVPTDAFETEGEKAKMVNDAIAETGNALRNAGIEVNL